MITKIILTLSEGLTEQERKDLQYLMTDAFAEFEGTRRGEYVSQRYSTLSGDAFTKKCEEVERRRTLARKLKLAAHQFELLVIGHEQVPPVAEVHRMKLPSPEPVVVQPVDLKEPEPMPDLIQPTVSEATEKEIGDDSVAEVHRMELPLSEDENKCAKNYDDDGGFGRL